MMTPEMIETLIQIVGNENYIVNEADLFKYGHDETETIQQTPEIVVKPKNTAEVAAIMTLCHQNCIPVTPRGAGTGLSGGAIPHKGGVVLSLENNKYPVRAY